MGFQFIMPQMPWDHKPPPAPPPPEVVAAFSDLLTGMSILAAIVVAAAVQQLYMHWRKGGARRAMISRCLQRSYRLPALASLRHEAITACAEMWLAFERRLASGGGGGGSSSPERPSGRPRSSSSLETVPEHLFDDDEALSAEKADMVARMLASTLPARPRTSEAPAVLAVPLAPRSAPDSPRMTSKAPPPGSPPERPPPLKPTLVFPADVDRRLDDGGSVLSDVSSTTSDGEDSPGRSLNSPVSPSRRPAGPPAERELPWGYAQRAVDEDTPAASLVRSNCSPNSTHAAAAPPPPPASPIRARRACCAAPLPKSRPASSLSKSAPGSGKAGRRQIVVLGDARAARSGVVERIGRMARKHGVELVVHEGIPRGCDALDVLHSQVDAALVVWDAALAEGRDHVHRHLSALRPLRSARSFSFDRLSEALLPQMPPPEAAAPAEEALQECSRTGAVGQRDHGSDVGGAMPSHGRWGQPLRYRRGAIVDPEEHSDRRQAENTTADRRWDAQGEGRGVEKPRGKPAWWPF
jgi:hypothetical protein